MKTKEQKESLKKCRHRMEIPFTVAAVVITLIVAALIVFLFRSAGKDQQAEKILVEQLAYERIDIEFAKKCGEYLLIAVVLFLFLKLLWELFKNAGIAMVNDIPFEKEHDPQIYEEYLRYCEMLGIREPPKFLLALQTGNLESDGITIKSERYLRVKLATLGIAKATRNQDILRFEVLHDLAHIAYHHYHYALLIPTVTARWLPFARNIYSRIMCYSADRLTAELMGRDECISVLLGNYMLSAYDPQYREEYIKRLKEQKLTLTERVSAALHNLTTETPSYPDRLRALLSDRNNGRII